MTYMTPLPKPTVFSAVPPNYRRKNLLSFAVNHHFRPLIACHTGTFIQSHVEIPTRRVLPVAVLTTSPRRFIRRHRRVPPPNFIFLLLDNEKDILFFAVGVECYSPHNPPSSSPPPWKATSSSSTVAIGSK